jgi:WD40 repeat protein
MLLAREALRIDPTYETKGTLLATLLRSPAALATYTLPIDSRPQNIAVAPDAKSFVVSDNNGNLRFYSTPGHRQTERLHNFGLVPLPVTFSTDGRRFLAVDWRGNEAPTLDVMDSSTHEVIRRLRFDQWLRTHQPLYEQRAMFAADGKHILFAYAEQNADGSDGAPYVDRWDMQSGNLVSRTRIGDAGLVGVGLIENGRVLYSITNEHIYLWQVTPWRQVTVVNAPAAATDGLGAVTPDGTMAAFGTAKGGIVFDDLRTGKQTIGAAGHVGQVQNEAISPDGRLFITVGDDAKVIVWSTHTLQPLEILTGHAGRITGLAFSADSKTLFTCSLDGSILEWDLGDARRFGRPFTFRNGQLDPDPAAPSTPPLAAAPDGSRIAVLAPGRKVDVVRLSDLHSRRTFGSHVTALAWSPNGKLVAAGGDDGRLQLRNAASGSLVRTLAGLHGVRGGAEAVQAVAFSPTGKWVAAVDGDFSWGRRPHSGTSPCGAQRPAVSSCAR